MRTWISRGAVIWLLILEACAPLVRVGDIDPPEGRQVLVEVEVSPKGNDLGDKSPALLVAALDGTGVSSLVMHPAPVVRSSSALVAETVAEEIASRVQGIDTPGNEAPVDDNELASDGRRLESIYASRGYFQARVSPDKREDLGFGGVRVVYEVLESSPTVVSEIRFAGACEDFPSDPEARTRLTRLCERARRIVPLRVGDIWEESLYIDGLERLTRFMKDAGFLHASVKGENWVSKDYHKASVWYRLDPGPLVRVEGEVEVHQNQTVPTARIKRRIQIEPGAIIDSTLLDRTERDVVELGPFLSAQAQPIRDETGEERPAAMKLAVQVAEAPKWEFTVGPSVVSDFVRLEMALPMRFAHRNLFGELVALDVKGKPALVFPDCFTGETCTDNTEFGLDSTMSLQVPSFFEEYLKFGIELSYRRDPSQDTKSSELGGSMGFSRRIAEGLTVRLGYNLSSFDYFDSSALANVTEEEALSKSEFRVSSQDLLAWLDAALVLDLRDLPLDTRNGFYAAFSTHLAEAWLGSDVAYLRTLGDIRGYLTPRFLPWLTFAARARLGWNFYPSGQGTPQSARFKSGGATTMRGFATDRIGDFVCATPGPTGSYLENQDCGDGSTDRTYIGGNHLVEGNFELRFRLRRGLGFAAFVDIGGVWSRLEDIKLGGLDFAIGPGFRYDLPIGPIRVDLGFLLGARPATELHISLGQAF